MRTLTTEEVAKMDKSALEAELSNRVYEAALLLEQMEHVGLIGGNGHHKAQRVAAYAVEQMTLSWNQGAKPVVPLAATEMAKA